MLNHLYVGDVLFRLDRGSLLIVLTGLNSLPSSWTKVEEFDWGPRVTTSSGGTLNLHWEKGDGRVRGRLETDLLPHR